MAPPDVPAVEPALPLVAEPGRLVAPPCDPPEAAELDDDALDLVLTLLDGAPPDVDVPEAELPDAELLEGELVDDELVDDVLDPLLALAVETGASDVVELCPHAASDTHAANVHAAFPQVSFMSSS